MVNSISGSSLIQTTMANMAFKSSQKTDFIDDNNENQEIGDNSFDKDLNYTNKNNGISFNQDNSSLINKVKEIASMNGNGGLSDKDIDYAIRYGRSILIDKTA